MTDLSFQLYSARNFQPWPRVFATLAAAGYTAVEGFGGIYGDLDSAGVTALKAELDRAGLAMPTGHFSIEMLEDESARVLDMAGTLGMRAIYCPWLAPEARPTDAAGWRAWGERLQKAGAPFRRAGLDFGWHNHDFEFFPLPDGSTPQEQIFAGGPDLSWEADLAWIVRGGADPLTWIARMGNRITAVHVKDIAPAGENADEDGWADVGHGTVPWKGLVAALKASTNRIFIIEHDNPSDLARLAARSLASFKTY